jgi:hypothetical protein
MVSTSAHAGTDAGPAATGRVTTASGDINYFRSDIHCRAPGSNEARPLGVVLAGPEAEGLYDQAVSLT